MTVFARPTVAPEKRSHRPPGLAIYSGGRKVNDMGTYSELLRDPRWQKMRLKKLEASSWACERCRDTATTLNVHHKRYVKGRMPWEYDEQELAVLCEPCHGFEHEDKDLRSALMARLAMDGPLGIEDFVAYGAGGVSAFHWMVEPVLQGMLDQIRKAKPLQFYGARAGAALGEKLIDLAKESRSSMDHLSDLLTAPDEAFVDDLVELLRKHRVIGGA